MNLFGRAVQTVADALVGKKEATPILGLDLGQAHDYTALRGLEHSRTVSQEHQYSCRNLRRFPLGSPHTTIVQEIVQIARQFPQSASLAVDMTGVGRPVVDMSRTHCPIPVWPITITSGAEHAQNEDGWRVPKKELVSVIQMLLQSRRLHIIKQVPDAMLLTKKLASLQVKITTAGHETFGAWRERAHDDCVLAIALGCWVGEHLTLGRDCIPKAGGRMMLSDLPEDIFGTDDRPRNDPRYFGGRPPQQGGLTFPNR
jgi:hypothetical protein